MTTPSHNSGHWPELEGRIPPQPQPQQQPQPQHPQQQPPHTEYAAKVRDLGSKVGGGTRALGRQAQATFAQTRGKIDTPANRARLAQTRTLPLPTKVYGGSALLIILLALFPWYYVSMTHRAAINMGFWGSSVGESAITGAFNGFGFGAMMSGMRATGSRDSYSEETMIHGLLMIATILAIVGLIAAAVVVHRRNARVGNIVAVATGVLYAGYLLSTLDGRLWSGSINAADSQAARQANPMAALSSSATTADSPLIYVVILCALVAAGLGAWQLWQAREAGRR
ncbi:hypothetical protein [Corynebacterium nasicanis]|uniref:ABC transporter permease n=1 Tax=Corynebacterium nasicanis TaxID=1448267 RepID=A0ABW1QC90_9CORY